MAAEKRKRKPILTSWEDVCMMKCSNPACGKLFEYSNFSVLCDSIKGAKPVCSFECGQALGQC